MSILSTIKSILSPSTGMVCPRCEKPLEGHDEAACARRMSRRYFFGVAAGTAVAVAGASAIPKLQEFVVGDTFESGVAIARASNRLLTIEEMSREILKTFKEEMLFSERMMARVNAQYDAEFLKGDGWGEPVATTSHGLLKPGDRISFAGVREVKYKAFIQS